MEQNEPAAKPWRDQHVYGLAVICLLAGIGIGYLTRAPFRANTPNSQVASPFVTYPSGKESSKSQMEQVLDSQAESLLARLAQSPRDPILLSEIGKMYFQRGQYRMAAKYYEDSARIKPDVAVFIKLGGSYHFDGDEGRALAAWNDALRLDPSNPDALYNIGFVKWNIQGNREEAIAAWRKLVKTNPNHPKRAQVEELIAQAEQHP